MNHKVMRAAKLGPTDYCYLASADQRFLLSLTNFKEKLEKSINQEAEITRFLMRSLAPEIKRVAKRFESFQKDLALLRAEASCRDVLYGDLGEKKAETEEGKETDGADKGGEQGGDWTSDYSYRRR